MNRLIASKLDPPLPKNVCIDPSTLCNLSCPLCPTGLKELNLSRQLMSFDTFRTVVDKIPSMRYLSMFNWGEPFLNPDIFKMIRYAKEKNITVGVHSNFSFKKGDEFFKEIADSGLDKLIISYDGATSGSYNKYRKTGNFDLVRHNIRLLRGYIKTTPKLVLQTIISRHNEHEMDMIKQFANELKIEFSPKPIRLGFDMCADWQLNASQENQKRMWLPENPKYVDKAYMKKEMQYYKSGICFDLFNTLIVNPDGTVQPCCCITKAENAFGDLTKQSLEEIWYGDKYRSSRALFLKKEIEGSVETICHNCNLFRKKI
jgi:radical SAM protein with 4Fe4S-binding SPASM domain